MGHLPSPLLNESRLIATKMWNCFDLRMQLPSCGRSLTLGHNH